MFDFTIIELIGLAASNSLAVFCLCNLIIAVILVGSSKTSPEFDGEKHHAIPKDDNIKKYRVSSGEKASAYAFIDRDEERNASSVSVDMISNEEESQDEEEREDDELRKRVEDFIEKINKSWRAEKLNAYSLGQY